MERGSVPGDLLDIVIDRIDQWLRVSECPFSNEITAEAVQLDKLGFDCLSPRKLATLALSFVVPGLRSRFVVCRGHAPSKRGAGQSQIIDYWWLRARPSYCASWV